MMIYESINPHFPFDNRESYPYALPTYHRQFSRMGLHVYQLQQPFGLHKGHGDNTPCFLYISTRYKEEIHFMLQQLYLEN